jgi:hypothetical protein
MSTGHLRPSRYHSATAPIYNDSLMVPAAPSYFKMFIVYRGNYGYNGRMQICSICRTAKYSADFFYRNKNTNRLHTQCKECYITKRRKTWRDHYHKYGSNYRKRAIERTRDVRNELRQRMLEYLHDKACAICGVNDVRVLEFDHIDPTKKSFGIAKALTYTFSWERILNEVSKCQILCANCHKIKTASESNWYKKGKTSSTNSDLQTS